MSWAAAVAAVVCHVVVAAVVVAGPADLDLACPTLTHLISH